MHTKKTKKKNETTKHTFSIIIPDLSLYSKNSALLYIQIIVPYSINGD